MILAIGNFNMKRRIWRGQRERPLYVDSGMEEPVDHHPEDVLRVFLHRSREVIQKPKLQEKLTAIALAVVEAGLFRRVAVQLYADRYGEKMFGWAGLTQDEQAWLETHDTLGPQEYARVLEFGVDLGNLFFVPHDYLPDIVDDPNAYLLSSQVDWKGPGYWHPDDMLFAPLLASDGTPLGNLTADEPANERIPTEHTAALLTPFLAIAALLVEQSLDRRRDPLTGSFNGPFFRDEMARMVKEGQLHAVLFLDMDNLKQTNDGQGHAAGDRLIQDVARSLEDMVCEVLDRRGRVFRLHGDEFVVLVRRGAPPLEAILTQLRAARDRSGLLLSLGGAPYRPGIALWELLQWAEQDMYEDKRIRKGRPHDPEVR